MPVISGKEQEWKDGKYVDTDKDRVINATEPLDKKSLRNSLMRIISGFIMNCVRARKIR